MQGPLSQAVGAMCTALLPQVSPRTAAGVGEVLRRLDTPLQLAVAGRIKSGKSTLVNALIGRRVAPTDIGECTRLVTRFRYGTVDRIEVLFKDGRRSTLPFAPDGGIPADLGVDLAGVSHLEAYLTSALLADITVIDTPGLGSLDAVSVSRTEALLGAAGATAAASPSSVAESGKGAGLDPVSQFAVAGAEAVVYVFTQSVRADDTMVLAAFTAATASRDAGPVNALAVLNKADTVVADSVQGAGGDIREAARILARSQADLLRPRVADVLPVIGLLAETAETGAFTAADAEALRALTGVDPGLFGAMTMAADLFTEMDAPIDRPTRIRLLQLLDLFGIAEAVSILRAEPSISAGELRRRLLDASGFADLRRRLGEVFRARADGIKASAALASMAALAASSDDWAERQRVHDAIEVLLQRPEAHQLRLMEALTLVSTGAVAMPADLTAEILRLGGSVRPEDQLGLPGAPATLLAAAALERAGWWRSFASFGATPAQSRVAHVVHRAYFLLWQDLRGDLPSGPIGALAAGNFPQPMIPPNRWPPVSDGRAPAAPPFAAEYPNQGRPGEGWR
ncbi:Dynamin family protein [Nakamurella panacisegetis]|uniref:Dynamin family protein n=1 Tax=Nakamurella panacisegetis TaxID=1090615 RepID=A0A1H0MC78_9ACTN|nr:dynamin family protein [Nakamurella panacisegetis]SDO77866.1 Dynamin family protein [Nakamurella panacisegetis]